MKKSSLRSSTSALALSLAIILHVLPSCKSHRCCSDALRAVQEFRSLEVQKFRSVDTVVLRDSVYRHDSVIYRERTIHDTVYITKEVYRNASHSTLNAQHSTQSDTVIVTEWRERVVQKPPERYVPKFYRWCTGLLIAILVLAIGRLGYRVMRR